MQRLLPLSLSVLLAAGCELSAPFLPDAGPDAGLDAGEPSVAQLFAQGSFTQRLTGRVSEAGFKVVALPSGRRVMLTISRDEAGHVAKRLVLSDAHGERWAKTEMGAEQFTDFTVHSSGQITLGIERRDALRDAFELVRLDGDGHEVHRQVLKRPQTIPTSDLSPSLPASPFAMRGAPDRSMVTGWMPWLRLEANGDDLVVGLLSQVDLLQEGSVLSAVLSLSWQGGEGYREAWARAVDEQHSLIAVAWQFDDLLWRDAATRLAVNVTPDGRVWVGRTLGTPQCFGLATRFGEVTAGRCRALGSLGAAHRYQPFAVTAFSPDGARIGTQIIAPDGLDEFVIFDMAVRGQAIALSGTAVRRAPSGEPAFYFEPAGDTSSTPLMPYDGYLTVFDFETGHRLHERFIDLGRAEHLVTLRWFDEGLVAGGGCDWNRWYGGMSLSRGADPLLVFDSLTEAPVVRSSPVSATDRHTLIWSLAVQSGELFAVGQSDAPMTHSGDADARLYAHGGLQLSLAMPPATEP